MIFDYRQYAMYGCYLRLLYVGWALRLLFDASKRQASGTDQKTRENGCGLYLFYEVGVSSRGVTHK